MSATTVSLLGFIVWSLLLLVWMESRRTLLVISKQVAANGFNPQNSNLSPFMQRLARAHANCIEGLPIFGGLMLIAIVSGNEAITDPLAPYFLGFRILQSLVHLSSLSALAVTIRFTFFALQMVIGIYWCIGFASSL